MLPIHVCEPHGIGHTLAHFGLVWYKSYEFFATPFFFLATAFLIR